MTIYETVILSRGINARIKRTRKQQWKWHVEAQSRHQEYSLGVLYKNIFDEIGYTGVLARGYTKPIIYELESVAEFFLNDFYKSHLQGDGSPLPIESRFTSNKVFVEENFYYERLIFFLNYFYPEHTSKYEGGESSYVDKSLVRGKMLDKKIHFFFLTHLQKELLNRLTRVTLYQPSRVGQNRLFNFGVVFGTLFKRSLISEFFLYFRIQNRIIYSNFLNKLGQWDRRSAFLLDLSKFFRNTFAVNNYFSTLMIYSNINYTMKQYRTFNRFTTIRPFKLQRIKYSPFYKRYWLGRLRTITRIGGRLKYFRYLYFSLFLSKFRVGLPMVSGASMHRADVMQISSAFLQSLVAVRIWNQLFPIILKVLEERLRKKNKKIQRINNSILLKKKKLYLKRSSRYLFKVVRRYFLSVAVKLQPNKKYFKRKKQLLDYDSRGAFSVGEWFRYFFLFRKASIIKELQRLRYHIKRFKYFKKYYRYGNEIRNQKYMSFHMYLIQYRKLLRRFVKQLNSKRKKLLKKLSLLLLPKIIQLQHVDVLLKKNLLNVKVRLAKKKIVKKIYYIIFKFLKTYIHTEVDPYDIGLFKEVLYSRQKFRRFVHKRENLTEWYKNSQLFSEFFNKKRFFSNVRKKITFYPKRNKKLLKRLSKVIRKLVLKNKNRLLKRLNFSLIYESLHKKKNLKSYLKYIVKGGRKKKRKGNVYIDKYRTNIYNSKWNISYVSKYMNMDEWYPNVINRLEYPRLLLYQKKTRGIKPYKRINFIGTSISMNKRRNMSKKYYKFLSYLKRRLPVKYRFNRAVKYVLSKITYYISYIFLLKNKIIYPVYNYVSIIYRLKFLIFVLFFSLKKKHKYYRQKLLKFTQIFKYSSLNPRKNINKKRKGALYFKTYKQVLKKLGLKRKSKFFRRLKKKYFKLKKAILFIKRRIIFEVNNNKRSQLFPKVVKMYTRFLRKRKRLAFLMKMAKQRTVYKDFWGHKLKKPWYSLKHIYVNKPYYKGFMKRKWNYHPYYKIVLKTVMLHKMKKMFKIKMSFRRFIKIMRKRAKIEELKKRFNKNIKHYIQYSKRSNLLLRVGLITKQRQRRQWFKNQLNKIIGKKYIYKKKLYLARKKARKLIRRNKAKRRRRPIFNYKFLFSAKNPTRRFLFKKTKDASQLISKKVQILQRRRQKLRTKGLERGLKFYWVEPISIKKRFFTQAVILTKVKITEPERPIEDRSHRYAMKCMLEMYLDLYIAVYYYWWFSFLSKTKMETWLQEKFYSMWFSEVKVSIKLFCFKLRLFRFILNLHLKELLVLTFIDQFFSIYLNLGASIVDSEYIVDSLTQLKKRKPPMTFEQFKKKRIIAYYKSWVKRTFKNLNKIMLTLNRLKKVTPFFNGYEQKLKYMRTYVLKSRIERKFNRTYQVLNQFSSFVTKFLLYVSSIRSMLVLNVKKTQTYPEILLFFKNFIKFNENFKVIASMFRRSFALMDLNLLKKKKLKIVLGSVRMSYSSPRDLAIVQSKLFLSQYRSWEESLGFSTLMKTGLPVKRKLNLWLKTNKVNLFFEDKQFIFKRQISHKLSWYFRSLYTTFIEELINFVNYTGEYKSSISEKSESYLQKVSDLGLNSNFTVATTGSKKVFSAKFFRLYRLVNFVLFNFNSRYVSFNRGSKKILKKKRYSRKRYWKLRKQFHRFLRTRSRRARYYLLTRRYKSTLKNSMYKRKILMKFIFRQWFFVRKQISIKSGSLRKLLVYKYLNL